MIIKTLSNGKEHIHLLSEGYRQEIPERHLVLTDTAISVLSELLDDGYKVIQTEIK